jgi:hypothetical protein
LQAAKWRSNPKQKGTGEAMGDSKNNPIADYDYYAMEGRRRGWCTASPPEADPTKVPAACFHFVGF